MNEAQTATSLIASYNELDSLMKKNLSFSRSRKQPTNPSFAGEKSTGWEVKAGTFKDGDQKATTKYGKTCWNSWWSTTRQDATDIFQFKYEDFTLEDYDPYPAIKGVVSV